MNELELVMMTGVFVLAGPLFAMHPCLFQSESLVLPARLHALEGIWPYEEEIKYVVAVVSLKA